MTLPRTPKPLLAGERWIAGHLRHVRPMLFTVMGATYGERL